MMRATLLAATALAMLAVLPGRARAQNEPLMQPGSSIAAHDGQPARLVTPEEIGQPWAPYYLPQVNEWRQLNHSKVDLLTAPVADKTVFIGSVGPGYANLADPAKVRQMLAAGNIGLYQHANGNASLTPAQRAALWAAWGPTGVGATGQGQSVGEIASYDPVPASYLSYFGGAYPNEANMNILTNSGDGTGTYTAGAGDAHPGTVYTGYTTAGDLQAMEGAISAANGAGARNVAIFMTPNGGGEDLDDPFATAPYWANVRAAALWGGGIALDVPPTYWALRGGAYQSVVRQMVAWATASGLRSSLTVSPYAAVPDAAGHAGGCGYDPDLLHNARALALQLAEAGTMPSQWVVENYGAPGATCGTGNDVATDATPNSLNAVALFLARTTQTAPPGRTPAGSNRLTDAGQMSSGAPMPVSTGALGYDVRPGPLRLADVAGAGDLATQSHDDAFITGGHVDVAAGSIGGPSAPNIPITTSGQALFLGPTIVQGAGGPAVLDANSPGELGVYAPGGGPRDFRVSGSLAANVRPGGGTAQALSAVLGRTYNILDFGAKVDCATDDSAAWQAALNAAGAAGGQVDMPRGCSVATGLVETGNGVDIHGRGRGASTVKAATLTGTVLTLNGSHVRVSNIGFASAGQQTAGSYVSMSGEDVSLDQFAMTGGYTPILIPGGDSQYIDHGRFYSTGRHTIEVQGGNDQFLSHLVSDNPPGAQPDAGIYVSNSNGLWIDSVDFIHSGNGLAFVTGKSTDALTWMFVQNSAFDTSSGCGILVSAASGSKAVGFAFTNTWTSTDANGVCLAGAGAVDGMSFVNHRSFNNAQRGFLVASGSNFQLDSSQVSGNSTASVGTYPGVEIGNNVSAFAVRNSRIGAEAGFPVTQAYGVLVDSGVGDNFHVTGNNLQGNTVAGLSDQSTTGTHKIIAGNLPTQTAAVAPTGSPYAYVAPTAGTIYLVGGTVNAVQLVHNGMSIPLPAASQAVTVAAGDTLGVNYAAAPTLTFVGN